MYTKSTWERKQIKEEKLRIEKEKYYRKLFECFAYFPVRTDNGRWVFWEKYLKEIKFANDLISNGKYSIKYLEKDIIEHSKHNKYTFEMYEIIRMK